MHGLDLKLPRLPDADSHHRQIHASCMQPGDQPGLRPGAARAHHDPVEPLVERIGLGNQLLGAGHVTESAGLIGAAAGNEIRASAIAAELIRDPPGFGVHVEAGLPVFERRAEDAIEKHVARVLVLAIGVGHAPLEQRVAIEPVTARGGGRLANVIRLHGALGDDHVGALGERFADQELQLAGLVASACEAGAVIALDPDIRTADLRAQPRHRLERCGLMTQAHASKAVQIEHVFPLRLAGRGVVPRRRFVSGRVPAGGAGGQCYVSHS